MKNLSIVLNAVLFVAVGVLFFLHFKDNNGSSGSISTPTDSTALRAKGKAVVFVDSDTLMANYTLAKEVKKLIEDKKSAAEATLKGKQNTFQAKLREYQNKASFLTDSERAATEKRLGEMQLDLERTGMDMENKLIGETTKLNDDLFTRVEKFLATYAKQNGHVYVMQYTRGAGGIIYGDSTLNVTADVVAKLNAAYKAEANVDADSK